MGRARQFCCQSRRLSGLTDLKYSRQIVLGEGLRGLCKGRRLDNHLRAALVSKQGAPTPRNALRRMDPLGYGDSIGVGDVAANGNPTGVGLLSLAGFFTITMACKRCGVGRITVSGNSIASGHGALQDLTDVRCS